MTTFTCSYKIQADKEKNRLYLIIKGFLVDEYVQRSVQQIASEARKLKSGFDVIDDISELTPATRMDAQTISRARSHVFRNGAGRVVTVVKNGKNKKLRGYNLRPIVASSLVEAERMLQ